MTTEGVNTSLIAFYIEAMKSIEKLAVKHGVNLQPCRAVLEGGAVHLSLSATDESALAFYGQIWADYAQSIGMPDYLEPGMNVINPDNGDEWIIIGLDPVSTLAPVRVMNAMLEHLWIDVETAKNLQPM